MDRGLGGDPHRNTGFNFEARHRDWYTVMPVIKIEPPLHSGLALGGHWLDNTRMHVRRATILVGLSVVLPGLGACTASRPTAINFSVRHLHNVERTEVLDAAEVALTNLGYSIAERDTTAGILTTRPIFDVRGDQPARRGLGISSPGRTRRVAEVRVVPAADSLGVYCRVVVQEQTTQAHRLLARDGLGSDTPTDTPIEREAAATRRQNTVWQTFRRDKVAERRILTSIIDQTGALPLGPE